MSKPNGFSGKLSSLILTLSRQTNLIINSIRKTNFISIVSCAFYSTLQDIRKVQFSNRSLSKVTN